MVALVVCFPAPGYSVQIYAESDGLLIQLPAYAYLSLPQAAPSRYLIAHAAENRCLEMQIA